MSAGSIVLIIIIVVVLLVFIGFLVGTSARRRRLRERFGPEYDRLVTERASRREAETELTGRQRRVQKLELRPLSENARASYADQWLRVQEQFVETPAAAVAEGQSLIEAVMRERGYPVDGYEQMLADLSVEHARTLDEFRSAHDISVKAASGQASTEDLRTAMLHYRRLFDELLAPDPDTSAETVPDEQAELSDQATASEHPRR